MNLEYIKKLIKTNRSGKVIKLMIDNVYNWSIHDFQTICKIFSDVYRLKKDWRLFLFIEKYFSKIHIKGIEIKHANKTKYSIEYWLHNMTNKYELYNNISTYHMRKCIRNKYSIFKHCINNININLIILEHILDIAIFAINDKVLKYMYSAKHINMFNKILQMKINRNITFCGYRYQNQNQNIKILLSKEMNTCYDTYNMFTTSKINYIYKSTYNYHYRKCDRDEFWNLIIYFLSDNIKNRIPILYKRVLYIHEKIKKIKI